MESKSFAFGVSDKDKRIEKDRMKPSCVHVKYSNAAKIAKHLGIDYAPAMVGFDIIQGRSVPILDGIVVAKEYQASIVILSLI